MTKLTIPQVQDIKFGNAHTKVLQQRHKVSAQTIWEIRTGKSWKNIKPPKVYNNPPKP